MFDDMCHLKPYSEKESIANQNDVTRQFSKIKKCVDRFHFPGHKKSDSYCRENCNPKTVLNELGITKINSPACEQAFSWIHKFKTMKSMNEGRFKFFLLYLVDLHNLHIENRVHIAANPLNKEREHWLQSKNENNSKDNSGQSLDMEETTKDMEETTILLTTDCGSQKIIQMIYFMVSRI